ncbi:MAG TPA: DUF4136 domain-containing protein [Vicinamibacterales bacterium]|nr:DUF4136 domain-containing protein [Vicinamibacterales bacterium]
MKRMKIGAGVVAIALALPVVLFGQKTSFDFDKTANFAAFKTFAQKKGTPANDQFVDKRITDAIDAELIAKGMTKNETSPDVTVVYHVSLKEKQDISTYNYGYAGGYGPYGWGWGGGWGGTQVMVNNITEGTLIIDIADAQKKQMVFRAVGVKEIDVQAKAEKRDKNVASAVKKMLKNYPPPPDKKKK